eukprot:Hpha_TRINITY_DN3498_c0_g1::TRINITY_DN3498_c0_g1_i1::g.32582::m.32582/K18729/ANGEL; protein angel
MIVRLRRQRGQRFGLMFDSSLRLRHVAPCSAGAAADVGQFIGARLVLVGDTPPDSSAHLRRLARRRRCLELTFATGIRKSRRVRRQSRRVVQPLDKPVKPVDKGSSELTIMTYNILKASVVQNEYLCSQMYPHCQEPRVHNRVLPWRKRLERVMGSVKKWQPDILCFQEVDCWPEVRAALRRAGYEGAHCRYDRSTEGVMLAWRNAAVKLRRCQGLELGAGRYALLGEFRICAPGSEQRLCVGTIHVTFDPRRGRRKCAEIGILTTAIGRFAGGGRVGDSQPDDAPLFGGCPPLRSAFRSVHGVEPEVTSSHGRFRGTLDYVWCLGVEPVAAEQPPVEDKETALLPSEEEGSDHLPVVCRVRVPNARGRSAILAGDFNFTPRSPLYVYTAAGGRYRHSLVGDPRRWSGDV